MFSQLENIASEKVDAVHYLTMCAEKYEKYGEDPYPKAATVSCKDFRILICGYIYMYNISLSCKRFHESCIIITLPLIDSFFLFHNSQ